MHPKLPSLHIHDQNETSSAALEMLLLVKLGLVLSVTHWCGGVQDANTNSRGVICCVMHRNLHSQTWLEDTSGEYRQTRLLSAKPWQYQIGYIWCMQTSISLSASWRTDSLPSLLLLELKVNPRLSVKTVFMIPIGDKDTSTLLRPHRTVTELWTVTYKPSGLCRFSWH